MRSQLRFVMHEIDEREFASHLFSDPSVGLIEGSIWTSESPELFHSIDGVRRGHCLIWSTLDVEALAARQLANRSEWRCESTWATIQFLRSQSFGSVVCEGRIAVGTDGAPGEGARGVERRYRALSKFIKSRYTNSVLRWCNPTARIGPAVAGRSANPSDPDRQVWVGPHALLWLREAEDRRVKQSKDSIVEARAPESAT